MSYDFLYKQEIVLEKKKEYVAILKENDKVI